MTRVYQNGQWVEIPNYVAPTTPGQNFNSGINSFLSDIGTGFWSNITEGNPIMALPSLGGPSIPTPPQTLVPNQTLGGGNIGGSGGNGNGSVGNKAGGAGAAGIVIVTEFY